MRKSRFPERKKREDGSYGCRGCGGDIPKNRRTWCSLVCKKKHDPFYVTQAVRERDKGICQHCGLDIKKAKDDWTKTAPYLNSGWSWRLYQEHQLNKPPREEFDHIVPFSEGGATTLENMQTLCTPCHKKKTAEWRRYKTKTKLAKKLSAVNPG